MEPTAAHDAGPIRRSRSSRLVAGVCAGVAERYGIDVTLVRLGVAVLTLCGGFGVPLYVAAWILVPEEGSDTAIAARLLADLGDEAGTGACPVHGRRDAAA